MKMKRKCDINRWREREMDRQKGKEGKTVSPVLIDERQVHGQMDGQIGRQIDTSRIVRTGLPCMYVCMNGWMRTTYLQSFLMRQQQITFILYYVILLKAKERKKCIYLSIYLSTKHSFIIACTHTYIHLDGWIESKDTYRWMDG